MDDEDNVQQQYHRLGMATTTANAPAPSTSFSMDFDAAITDRHNETQRGSCPHAMACRAQTQKRRRVLLVCMVVASLLLSAFALVNALALQNSGGNAELRSLRIKPKGYQIVDPAIKRAVVTVRLTNRRRTCLDVKFSNVEIVWTPRVWYEHYNHNATELYGGALRGSVLATSDSVATARLAATTKRRMVALEVSATGGETQQTLAPLYLRVDVTTQACGGHVAHKTTVTRRLTPSS